MSNASENQNSSAQLADLSSELDQAAADEQAASESEATGEEGAPTEPADAAAAESSSEDSEPVPPSSEDEEWLRDDPVPSSNQQDLYGRNQGADQADSLLDARKTSREASREDRSGAGSTLDSRNNQTAASANTPQSLKGSTLDSRARQGEQTPSNDPRQLEGTVMDSRATREVKGRSISNWLFRDSVMDTRAARELKGRAIQSWLMQGTALDTRAAREVKGQTITVRKLDETVLDTRAARELKGRVIEARDQRLAGTILDARAQRTNTQSPLTASNLARRFSPQLLMNPTPPTTGRFFILLGPVPDFAFHECSGLAFRLETENYAEGGSGRNFFFPKHVENENIVFSRGLVFGPGWIQLRRWRESMLDGGPPLQMNGVIVMQNDLGVPICFWRFKNGFPVRWTGPTLKPGSTDLAVEELEIAHEGLKVIDIALAADMLVDSAVGMGSVMSSSEGSSAMSDGVSAAQSVMTGDVGSLASMAGG